MRKLTIVMILLAIALASAAHAVRPMHVLRGSGQGVKYGAALDGVGDLDRDGAGDFIVGEPLSDGATGRAIVYSGRSGEVLYELFGARSGTRFGYSVVGLGDVDGDAVPDFAVGAPLEGGGRVNVYSGADGGLLFTLDGGGEDDKLGAQVGAAGDVDGDGLGDLVVSAPGAGRVTIFSGARAVPLREHAGFQGVKGAIGGEMRVFNGDGEGDIRLVAHSAGDVDGDGFVDLVVGDTWAELAAGQVFLYSGRDGGEMQRWTGALNGSSYFGFSVDSVGDLDGDGRREILIGASGTFSGPFYGGEVQVRSGRTGEMVRHHLAPPTTHHYMGRAVRGVGDVDGDGTDDYLVGLPYRGPNIRFLRGSAWLYSGRTGEVLGELDGPKKKKRAGWDVRFGYNLAAIGDVNGNGVTDFAIAAPGERKGQGSVRVYSGEKLLRKRPGVR